MLVELGVDRDVGAGGAVKFDLQDGGLDTFKGTQGAVLHAEVALIAQKPDAVVNGDGLLATSVGTLSLEPNCPVGAGEDQLGLLLVWNRPDGR